MQLSIEQAIIRLVSTYCWRNILCMKVSNLLNDFWRKSLSKQLPPSPPPLPPPPQLHFWRICQTDRQLAATNSHWKLPPCHKPIGAVEHFFKNSSQLESRPTYTVQPKHTRKMAAETAVLALLPAKSPSHLSQVLCLMLPFTDWCIAHFTGM